MKKLKIATIVFLSVSSLLNMAATAKPASATPHNDTQDENNLSIEEKLYGLSKLWKEASYNFAFFDQVPELNWDSCYQDFITHVMETKTDWEYYLILQKFFALLKDGHTRVLPPAELRNKYYGTATTQIKTRLIQDKVIITWVSEDSNELKGLTKGMEILAIDDTEVHEYAKKYVAPYMYASTPQDLTLQIYGHFLLSGSASQPAVIKVKDFNGAIKEYKIYRKPWLIEEEVLKGESMYYKELPGNIGYLKFNNFIDSLKELPGNKEYLKFNNSFGRSFKEKFDSIYTKILDTDGLIIDIRSNFGGSTELSHYVLKHFATEKFQSATWSTPAYNAAHNSWGQNKKWYKQRGRNIYPHKDKTIYTKSMNVIVDESTFSGAEDFCAGYVTMKRGKLIGNKTAGSTGNPYIFNLPGGGSAMICTKKDVFPDGKEYVGYGIAPDIEVGITVEDIRNGNDEALNAAIKDLSGNKTIANSARLD